MSQIWLGVQQFSSLAPGGILPVGRSLFKRWYIGNGAPFRPAAQTLLILINFSTINFEYHVKRGIISKEVKGPLSDIKLTFSCVLEETYRTRDHIYKCNLVSLSSSATVFASDLYRRCVCCGCVLLCEDSLWIYLRIVQSRSDNSVPVDYANTRRSQWSH